MSGVDVFIFAAVGVGICFAAFNFAVIQRTKVNPGRTYQPANSPLIAVQAELAKVEQFPSMEGRQMVMVLAPR